ncbi:glycosyltransferase family 39 protein [Streptomyces sp. WAC01280]|uniref:ArnT family glycosyltransferase n=1 Tax=Streptomyces sp. WAC01280 TaxID=2487424 RepID=UPI000F77A822|nr:phospholipid carrier-dependent glycosyltransferase [Streptomyces sp. WAC01280]RSS56862.1 phospholipid carrier-dependent glycosyltransferase [Streptomyces sp. WAC01280]
MTFSRTTAATAAAVEPVSPPRPRPRDRDRMPVPTVVWAALAAAVTTCLRLLQIGRAGDLFVDETIYRRLGVSAGQGEFPRTDEGLFFLHPPGHFYMEAGWIRLVGDHSDVIASVHSMRVLNALLAGVTAALIVFLVARVRSRGAGLLAGLVFALDQFCIRQNDRVLLETGTMVWVLAGYLVLVGLTRPEPPPWARRRALLAGFLLGLAVLTKDHAALITVLPLLAALLLGWGPPRRLVALALTTIVSMYGVYVALIAGFGHFDEFWLAKTSGVRRLLGLVQETGFNAPGTPSLSGRLLDELPGYTTTYLLLVLTPVALVLLLRRKEPVYRLLALFHASAIVTLGYALSIGTLEEQALYLLFVPNLVALAVTVPLPHAGRRVLRTAVIGTLAALLAVPAVVYAQGRWTADDGFSRLRSYLLTNVPAGSGIVTVDGQKTRGVTSWAFDDTYRLGNWTTPEARAAENATYLIVPWRVIEQGYGRSTLAEVRELTDGLRPVFSFDGPTYGTLALYRLPAPLPGPDIADLAVPSAATTGPLLPAPGPLGPAATTGTEVRDGPP